LLAPGGIKKPSYYAYSLFHRLGSTRIAAPADNVLVTRREDKSLAIAIWNLSPPDQVGSVRTFDMEFQGLRDVKRIYVSRIDADHSNTLAAYAGMGSPRYPTEKQVRQVNDESALRLPETMFLIEGHLPLTVPVNGLVLLEVAR
jgi:xylan 1,4-beta-xylosidase